MSAAEPSVFWSGATAEMYLHPRCATDLAVRLLRDVHELENPDYYARRRGPGVAP